MVNNIPLPTTGAFRRKPVIVNNLLGLMALIKCPCCLTQAPKFPAGLCDICRKQIEKQRLERSTSCVICALPLEHAGSADFTGPIGVELYCGQCQANPPRFERCIAAVEYSPPVAILVNNLKHHARLAVLEPMLNEMLCSLDRHTAGNIDLLIPVPLHRSRLVARGFNQSLELARLLSHAIEAPLARDICIRTTAGEAQQMLTRKARMKNLQNAFKFTARLDGLRIAIIDDVVTTTATVESIAREAMAAGALGAEVWCFARTPPPQNIL